MSSGFFGLARYHGAQLFGHWGSLLSLLPDFIESASRSSAQQSGHSGALLRSLPALLALMTITAFRSLAIDASVGHVAYPYWLGWPSQRLTLRPAMAFFGTRQAVRKSPTSSCETPFNF